MNLSKIFDNHKEKRPSIVTIGTFDGVHKGHQKILKKIVGDSKKLNLKSIVLTFFPHPRTVLNPKTPLKLINTIDERKSHFENLGIDILITHPFDKNFSELSPEEFVRDILITKLNVKKILIGYDHRFGKNRVAGIDDLKKLALKYKFDVNEISVEEQNNVSISSTKIRDKSHMDVICQNCSTIFTLSQVVNLLRNQKPSTNKLLMV